VHASYDGKADVSLFACVSVCTKNAKLNSRNWWNFVL